MTTATGSVDAEATSDAVAESRREWRAALTLARPRYLVFTALSAVFGMQFGVAELGVPLWIAHETAAPEVLVALLLILNTVIVVIFQVPLSRGTHDFVSPRGSSAISAWLMAGCVPRRTRPRPACPWAFAIAVLVIAAIAHAFAEVLSQAGGWGLSFELADPCAPAPTRACSRWGTRSGRSRPRSW